MPHIRILAAVVVPPHLSVSGGSRAAEQLSAALVPYCDVNVASMMNGGGAGLACSTSLSATRVHVRSWLPPLLPWSRLPNRYSTLFYRSDLPDLVAANDYDLVHIHNPMPALEMARVARACLTRGIPYVVSTHGFNEVANGAEIYDFDRLRLELWHRLVVTPVSRVVRGAAAVFALSPADVPIVRNMGFAGEPTVVFNGIHLPPPASTAADAEALDRLGIPRKRVPGQITCMFLANHTPNKGLPVLLQAFARLAIPYLLIVGGEKRSSVDYGRLSETRIPGQGIIVTGRLSDAEVGALFRRSDLFIFPTLADTFPLAILEAMSQGLPVLASRVGGIPHQLNEACGMLVQPGSPDSLSNAILELAAVPERLTTMGQNARNRVEELFTWERAASQTVATYGDVIGAHRLARQSAS